MTRRHVTTDFRESNPLTSNLREQSQWVTGQTMRELRAKSMRAAYRHRDAAVRGLVALLVFAHCPSSTQPPPSDKPAPPPPRADLVLIGGKVISLDPETAGATAI